MASGIFEGTLKVYASQGNALAPGESGELIFAIPLAVSVRRVLGMPVDVARVSMIFLLVLWPGLARFSSSNREDENRRPSID